LTSESVDFYAFDLPVTVGTVTELRLFYPHIQFDYIESINVGVGERMAAAAAAMQAEIECLSV
jgi:hypothetical protein